MWPWREEILTQYFWCWETCWQQLGADLENEVCREDRYMLGYLVLLRFWSWSFGKSLKMNFGQYFSADVWLRLWSWISVEILKLGLVQILKFKFCGDASLDEILELMLDRDFEDETWSKFVLELVIWNQRPGLLRLWQYLKRESQVIFKRFWHRFLHLRLCCKGHIQN